MAGRAAGLPFNLSSVGKHLRGVLQTVYGHGDYDTNFETVSTNSLIKGKVDGKTSLTFSDGTDANRIRYREYIGELLVPENPSAFNVTRYQINPGLASFVPVLSHLADVYTSYRMEGLMFEYVSESSDYVSHTTMGSVTLTGNHNPNQPNYNSKVEANNSNHAISRKPSKSMIFGWECKNQNANGYFLRDGPTTQELGLTDIGSFQVCTSLSDDYTPGSKLGELWITYDVVLKDLKTAQHPPGHAHWRGNAVNTVTSITNLGTGSWLYNGIFKSITTSTTTNYNDTVTITLPYPGILMQLGINGNCNTAMNMAVGSGYSFSIISGGEFENYYVNNSASQINAPGTAVTAYNVACSTVILATSETVKIKIGYLQQDPAQDASIPVAIDMMVNVIGYGAQGGL